MKPLEQLLERHPLALPLVAGALARVVAAVAGYGFHARDDYFHVLEPALRWIADPSFDWDASGLPGAGLRSHLFPRLVQGGVLAARALGATSPEAVLRTLHLLLGAYSLLAIPAVFLLSRRLLDARGARLATWLAALHVAMPYVGTRLFLESLAVPPLVLGLYLASFASPARLLGAGALIGAACAVRYQCGVAALAVAALVAARDRKATHVLALAAGGALALSAQGLFDLATTGHFLGPLLANLRYNAAPPEGLTRMSPLAYVGLFVLLTAPPATLVIAPAMWRAARALPLVSIPWAAFVLAHSLIPHKEERFMIPVLPLFLILLAAAPSAFTRAQRAGSWRWLSRLGTPLAVWAVALHLALLPVGLASRSQAGVREALASLREDGEARALLVMGPEAPTFFLGRDDLPVRRTGSVDAVWLGRALSELERQGVQPNRFMAFAADQLKASLLLAAVGLDCDAPQVSRGWWLDRLIYRINPEHNRRRSPVLVWSCERPSVASVP